MQVEHAAFIHLDLTTLQTMLEEWQACLTRIAVGNQSYTLGQRTFTRANLGEVASMVGALAWAVSAKGGTAISVTYADMSGVPA